MPAYIATESWSDAIQVDAGDIVQCTGEVAAYVCAQDPPHIGDSATILPTKAIRISEPGTIRVVSTGAMRTTLVVAKGL